MSTQEFSYAFDTLLNSYALKAQFGDQTSIATISLDEYEKSVFLTKAQEEIIVNLYNGRNAYGEAFETTEEMRRYLETLVQTKVYSIEEKSEGTGVSEDSIFFVLPEDLAFITMEQIQYDDESLGCYNEKTASVYPVTQDEYNKIKNNPFRGPTKYKAIRLDSGKNKVELISKYKIKKYMLRYLAKPTPIILVDLPEDVSINGEHSRTDCALNSVLHNIILDRAVQLAAISKGINIK